MGHEEPSCNGSAPKRIKRSLSQWFTGERIVQPTDPDGDLIYDALLSMRGWGEAEFRTAEPELRDAARWTLYAERLVPILHGHEAIQGTPLPADAAAKAAAVPARLTANRQIELIRAELFPDG